MPSSLYGPATLVLGKPFVGRADEHRVRRRVVDHVLEHRVPADRTRLLVWPASRRSSSSADMGGAPKTGSSARSTRSKNLRERVALWRARLLACHAPDGTPAPVARAPDPQCPRAIGWIAHGIGCREPPRSRSSPAPAAASAPRSPSGSRPTVTTSCSPTATAQTTPPRSCARCEASGARVLLAAVDLADLDAAAAVRAGRDRPIRPHHGPREQRRASPVASADSSTRSIEESELLFRVNVLAPIVLTRAAIAHMATDRGGAGGSHREHLVGCGARPVRRTPTSPTR